MNEENYLAITIESKSPDRALEIARPFFEIFENVARFWLNGTRNYDIGIFSFKFRGAEQRYAMSIDSVYNSWSAKGVIQKVPISDMIVPKEMKNFGKILGTDREIYQWKFK